MTRSPGSRVVRAAGIREAELRPEALELLSAVLAAVGVDPAGGPEPLRPLPVSVLEAVGGTLAADVVAPAPVPAIDTALTGGYAVRSGAGPVLTVLGDLTVGSWEPATVGPDTCYTVTAGSPLPAGADTVVPRSATDGGLATVRFDRRTVAGDGVRHAGEMIAPGAVLALAGTRVSAGQVALFAAAGISHVTVLPPPRVVVASIGDGRVDSGLIGTPERLADPSAIALTALASAAGAQALRIAAVPDEDGALGRLVDDHAHHADLLVVTGGLSPVDGVGVASHHAGPAHQLRDSGDGVTFAVPGLSPATVIGFGRVGSSRLPVVCLPADVLGAVVGFELLLRPLLQRLAGEAQPFRHCVRARLDGAVRGAGGELRPAKVRARRSGGYTVRALPGGVGFLAGYAEANGLLVLPGGFGGIAAGSPVDVLLLAESLLT